MERREALLDVMAAARNDVDTLVAGYGDADWLEDLSDGWRRKDIFAHIVLWDRVALWNIDGTPVPDADEVLAGREWDLDYFNETMRARQWDLSVEEIRAEGKAAYDALVAAVRSADESDVAPGGRVFQVIDVDSTGHYAVHLPIPDCMHERWPEHVERVEVAD